MSMNTPNQQGRECGTIGAKTPRTSWPYLMVSGNAPVVTGCTFSGNTSRPADPADDLEDYVLRSVADGSGRAMSGIGPADHSSPTLSYPDASPQVRVPARAPTLMGSPRFHFIGGGGDVMVASTLDPTRAFVDFWPSLRRAEDVPDSALPRAAADHEESDPETEKVETWHDRPPML
jgi:hypothetical protein